MTQLEMIILASIMIACGIVAYGTQKGTYRSFCKHLNMRYARSDEIWCWALLILGPLGLILAMDFRQTRQFMEDDRFCFLMPNNLKEKKIMN